MRGIGKTSTGSASLAKTWFVMSAAVLLAAAAFVLLPTKASAQFNIDGIIRGAIGRGAYGYRRPSHHSSSHESRRDSADKAKDSDDDAADSKTGKGIKSANDGSSGNPRGSDDSQSASSGTPPPPAKGGPSGGPPGGSSKPSSNDVPAFAPSR